MKELHGQASTRVAASPEESFALLAAVEDYPAWYPEVVRRVELIERSTNGLPAKARAQLHVAYGPLVRDFNLLLAVDAQRPGRVTLTRIPHDSSDPERFEVTWRIDPGQVNVELRANLSVPRLLPVGGIGESIASGFAGAAAAALSRTR